METSRLDHYTTIEEKDLKQTGEIIYQVGTDLFNKLLGNEIQGHERINLESAQVAIEEATRAYQNAMHHLRCADANRISKLAEERAEQYRKQHNIK